MASKAGIFPAQHLGDHEALYPQHNPETSAPGLPVKAEEIIYQGVMVAYDPANSQAEVADPAMAATAVVVGVNAKETVDNSTGAKGAKKVMPMAGVWRMKSDGNLTAAHLYKRVRVVDDHTVGVLAGDGDDRVAGILIGVDSTFAWVIIGPATALRAPVEYSLTSTNGTAGAAADLAALKAEAELIGDDVRAIHAALVTAGILAPAAA